MSTTDHPTTVCQECDIVINRCWCFSHPERVVYETCLTCREKKAASAGPAVDDMRGAGEAEMDPWTGNDQGEDHEKQKQTR